MTITAKRMISSFVAVTMLFCSMAVTANAAPADLDDATKQEYYAEYVEIANEVAEATELDISVLPMDEISEEDWCTPEEFRSLITSVANSQIVCTAPSEIQPFSTGSAKKNATISANNQTYTISITGSFETNVNSTAGRQYFTGINSITSSLSGGVGSWRQTGYEGVIIDAGRTYAITVSGRLTVGNAVFANQTAYVEFYCSATGVIS